MKNKCTEIDYPFGAESKPLYCPACGTMVLAVDEPVSQPACEHVDFVYVDTAGEFEYIKPELEKIVTELNENEDPDYEDDPWGTLYEKVQGNTKFVMEIITSGMACGPVSLTVAVGFDMHPQSRK